MALSDPRTANLSARGAAPGGAAGSRALRAPLPAGSAGPLSSFSIQLCCNGLGPFPYTEWTEKMQVQGAEPSLLPEGQGASQIGQTML